MNTNEMNGLTLWCIIALERISKISGNYPVNLCHWCNNFNDYSIEHMNKFHLSRLEFFNLIDRPF